MRVTYDSEANVAYVYLVEHIEPDEASSREVMGDDLALDYDDDGKLVGFEILNARRLLRRDVLSEAERMTVDLNKQ